MAHPIRILILLVSLTTLVTLENRVRAGDAARVGSVTFAFDGGTLRCTFGAKSRAERPEVAMIVYPTTAKMMSDEETFMAKKPVEGSAVVVIDSNGKRSQLDRSTVHEWARDRIDEMSGRRSSVAENSFVSAVVHTVATGRSVRVWAFDAQELLEAGEWSKLFDRTKKRAAKADPFGGDPFK